MKLNKIHIPLDHPVFNVLRSKVFLVLGVILLLFMSIATLQEIQKKHSVDQEIETLRNEIAALENQNAELSGLIDYLKTDDFVEKEGRTKLGLAKSGEQVVVVSREGSVEAEDGMILDTAIADEGAGELALAGEVEGGVSNARHWWVYFFGKQTYSLDI